MPSKDLILVTGCSGRIGTRVVNQFADEYQVIGFDVFTPKNCSPRMDFINMDLTSEESVEKGFKEVKEKHGDHVVSMVHLAAYYSFSGEHPELYDKVTVKGTQRILHHLQSFNCEQFIFSSTQLVMKECKIGETINEDSPVEATWGYPISKVKTESILHSERGNIPVVIMRIAGCYDDECHSIPISNQIQRIYEKQFASRVFPGNIHSGAPFLHLADLTEAIANAVQKRKELPPDLTLLIGEDRTLSTDQLQRIISKLCYGREITTYRIPKIIAKIGAWLQCNLPGMPDSFIKPWMIDYADQNWTLDVSKAKKYLGWQPKHYLDQVLPIMIEDLKKDPLKFYKDNLLTAPKWLENKYGKK